MVSELEKRERSASEVDPEDKSRGEEERIKKKLQEEIARIRARHANKGAAASSDVKNDKAGRSKEGVGATFRAELDKEKENVSSEKVGKDYTAEKLTEIRDIWHGMLAQKKAMISELQNRLDRTRQSAEVLKRKIKQGADLLELDPEFLDMYCYPPSPPKKFKNAQ